MIDLPDLDDRTFDELAAEARARIPTLAPRWTDHNPTDPGVVLVELFAWLTEIVLYRLDRVPDRSYRTFLGLLRGPRPPGDALPASLDDAIRATLAELRERYRAITPDDFEHLALDRWPALDAARALGVPGVVRRARCFPEQSPATLVQPGTRAEGHYTLALVADSLAAARGDLAAFDPARRHALELDGAAGYVDCGSHASLAITRALTLSAWIFPRDLARRQAIVGKAGAGEYELVLETTGALTFRHADGVDGGTSDAGIAPGRWTHVAAVREPGAVRFYLDGKPAGAARLGKAAAATTAPVLLGRSPGGGNFFGGYLRDVCVWDAARGEDELGGDLRRMPPGIDDAPTAPRPVACWRLDSAADGAVARDAETPAAATARPRDGKLLPLVLPTQPAPARWRDVVRPLPAAPALLAGLAALLDEWRLLTTKVHVIDHQPLAVNVAATLYLRSDGVPKVVRELAAAAVDRFLDPLRGWGGDGWPFGRAIFESDLHAVFDSLPGVDFVGSVAIALADPSAPGRPAPPKDDQGAVMGVALHPHELPDLGSATFQLFHRVGTQWEPIS